jgi:hypothetical protein
MIQYGRTAMRIRQKHSATRVFLVLAVVLASLWAGGLASSVAENSAGQLAGTASRLGIESAALPDRVPALRPSPERPDPGGRLLPLLLGLLVASLPAAYGVPARRRRSGPAPARSPVHSAPPGPRAPPCLQPA